jgi:hypothetical protein
MQKIIGYFNNIEMAADTADYLRQKEFQGEISIIGRHNEEMSSKPEDSQDGFEDTDHMPILWGAIGLSALTFGATPTQPPGFGSIMAAGPIAGLISNVSDGDLTSIFNQWGIWDENNEGLQKSIESGIIALLIKCDKKENNFVVDTLKKHKAREVCVL